MSLNLNESFSSYQVHPWELGSLFVDPERVVARGEGLGQNPRSRRPAPV